MLQTDSLQAGLLQGSDSLTTSGDTVHRFSVWRITQRMQGCTPQQIDSVIQRYMPRRELHLSTRPDTLEIPGLHATNLGHLSDSLDRVYELGFFQNNPLLHSELRTSQHGRSADPLPYSLRGDDWVVGTLLLCFFVLVYIIRNTRNQFSLHLREFFYPPKEHKGLFVEQTSFEANSVFFLFFLLSTLGGLVTFIYSQYTLNLFLSQVSPYLLLCIYVGCFMAYFLSKLFLIKFVNWVFFEKSKQKIYGDSNSFLISMESLLIFPVVVIAVLFNFPIFYAAIFLGILVLFVKILLLFKCYSILFGQKHCLFHLFAYLCALEIMPMLALLRSLLFVTDNLIIKY